MRQLVSSRLWSAWGLGALLLVGGCADDTTTVTGQANGETVEVSAPIVGGSQAPANAFPFHVYLYITEAGGNISNCSGALLSNQWVITAAHCVDENIQGLYAFFGMNHVNPPLDGTISPYPDDYEQLTAVYPVTAQNVVIHPNYLGQTVVGAPHYDLALIKVPNVVYTNHVKAIALAPAGATGSTYATGWGATDANDPYQQYSPYLKVAGLPLQSNTTCNNSNFLVRDLYSDEICAGYANASNPYKATCFGDSGGPFFRQQSNGARDLLGVTSWGDRLCADYSVFAKANTQSNLTWINNTIAH